MPVISELDFGTFAWFSQTGSDFIQAFPNNNNNNIKMSVHKWYNCKFAQAYVKSFYHCSSHPELLKWPPLTRSVNQHQSLNLWHLQGLLLNHVSFSSPAQSEYRILSVKEGSIKRMGPSLSCLACLFLSISPISTLHSKQQHPSTHLNGPLHLKLQQITCRPPQLPQRAR